MKNAETTRAAIKAAVAFIASANEALKDVRVLDGTTYINTGKASGAMRRKSMDLTRALATMRKP